MTSKLQYKATILPNPLINIIQQINKHIFNFLRSKKDRINRKKKLLLKRKIKE